MDCTKTQPALYERLLEVASRHMFDDNDRSVLLRAALALMPVEVRLMQSVAAYAGEAALVSDVVAALGLGQRQCVVVGKALSRLGYQRKMIRLNSTVYPVWLKGCKLPKLALWEILNRQEEAYARLVARDV